mmetsp:Transcript_12787/g.22623  ORF Transcript_12787/g.22623 Transcript_12787/m.22623 type:complete len:232 (+) Transcript_12787:1044-1739(+)
MFKPALQMVQETAPTRNGVAGLLAQRLAEMVLKSGAGKYQNLQLLEASPVMEPWRRSQSARHISARLSTAAGANGSSGPVAVFLAMVAPRQGHATSQLHLKEAYPVNLRTRWKPHHATFKCAEKAARMESGVNGESGHRAVDHAMMPTVTGAAILLCIQTIAVTPRKVSEKSSRCVTICQNALPVRTAKYQSGANGLRAAAIALACAIARATFQSSQQVMELAALTKVSRR